MQMFQWVLEESYAVVVEQQGLRCCLSVSWVLPPGPITACLLPVSQMLPPDGVGGLTVQVRKSGQEERW